MPNDVVISVEGLSKSYLVGHEGPREKYQSLRDTIARHGKNYARKAIDMARGRQIIQGDSVEEFWALRDVSFEIKRGEVLGIIGRNGAGKSTLLKILSRITEPTSGRVTLDGRVASLLEVGTGFHPELTGRENIFLNGAILGMGRAEIKNKFDAIVAFAEVEKFLDTPVKRYSSGMYVRLAFAVAAHLEPEILIVDEVLAVGDAEFQKKCLGKMQEVSKGGRTVLFVSHNMAAVKTLCRQALLLEAGRLTSHGDVGTIVNNYFGVSRENAKLELLQRSDRSGNGIFRWTQVQFLNHAGQPVEEIISGEPLIIRADYVVSETVDHDKIIIAISLRDEYRSPVAGFVSDEMGTEFNPINSSGSVCVQIPQLLLRGGLYSLNLLASHFNTASENFYDFIEDSAALRVLPGDFWGSGKTNRTGSYSLIPATMANSRDS
jgi:lipopolysaccharide transport system ATP-binding protein